MGLRTEAAADLIDIVHDDGEETTITSPAGVSEAFTVLESDIHHSVDPGTGDVVTGRQASLSVLVSDLEAAGFGGIEGVADETARPWLATVTDAQGRTETMKVAATHPDATLGIVILMLEGYES